MERHFSIKQAAFKQKYFVGDARKKAVQDLKKQSKYLRAEDIAKAVIEYMNKYNIPLDKIVSVSTDGDKSMVVKRKQFASLLPEIKAFLHEKGILNILNYWTICVHKIYSSWLTHQFNLNRGSYFIRKEIITFYSKH